MKKAGNQSIPKKVIEISVVEGLNLAVSGTVCDVNRMLPFYSYDFYTFEIRSHTGNGPNPQFDNTKRFEVEANQQFLSYMKSQILQIHLIDESVDMTRPGSRDYIGTARIPLHEVITKQRIE